LEKYGSMGSENFINRSDPFNSSMILTSGPSSICASLPTRKTFSADQSLPSDLISAAQEKQFHSPASFFAREDPRRDDARLIQYKQIPRVEKIRHITEDTMLKLSIAAMQHQQAR